MSNLKKGLLPSHVFNNSKKLRHWLGTNMPNVTSRNFISSSFLHMNQRPLPFNVSTGTQKTTIVLWFTIMSRLVHGCLHNFHSLSPTLALFGLDENCGPDSRWAPITIIKPHRTFKGPTPTPSYLSFLIETEGFI